MKVESVANTLRSQLFGQDAAIAAILPVFETFFAGLSPEGRPAATFLLLGPTGTGKTKTVEAFAKALHGDERMLVKIDCGEFHADHEAAKILGSPPGYLGHRETQPLLTQSALSCKASSDCALTVVLFDEIEKAAPSLLRALLGVLDKGRLTLGDNNVVNFEKTIIFMTSNLGAAQMQASLTTSMGFPGPQVATEDLHDKLRAIGAHAARKKFSPEFMNRIDAVITYDPLTADALRLIIHHEIEELGAQIHRKRGPAQSFYLIANEAARAYLLKHGTSQMYGARELKRLIQREIVQPLAAMVNQHRVFSGGFVYVTCGAEGLRLTAQPAEEWAQDATAVPF